MVSPSDDDHESHRATIQRDIALIEEQTERFRNCLDAIQAGLGFERTPKKEGGPPRKDMRATDPRR
jgi:hypothetical protein